MKQSPTSRPDGAGTMEIPPTARLGSTPADEALVRGMGLVGVGIPERDTPPPAAASRLSSPRRGSSSASGAAPSAAIASAMRGQRASGSLSSIRRIAASRSGGHSGHSSRMERGARSTWACMTVRVDPRNGGTPVTSS